MENEQKQRLLLEDETPRNHDYISPTNKELQFLRAQNCVVLTLLVLSFGINTLFFTFYLIRPQNSYLSQNAGLVRDVQQMQRWRYTAYSQPNETARDEAWNSIDVDRTIVALDHDEAVALGLPPTAHFPLDSGKDIYVVNAYHQLHCLKLLYTSFQEAHHRKEFSNSYTHILHCLDTLRGDVECQADGYLYSVSLGLNLPIDEGQTMRCKDFSKLDKWTIDHHSCFKYTHVNEEEPLTEMHQWRNCPKDSPYGQKMRALLGYDENWVPEFKQNFGPEFPEGYDDRVIGEH